MYCRTIVICLLIIINGVNISISQDSKHSIESEYANNSLKLVQAAMCESFEGIEPKNPSMIFSIATEKVICFTFFNPVIEDSYIFHKWYRKDKISTVRKLSLKSPQWATYSSIQLRETDKGPWRVEIVDPKGYTIDILRFSITD